MNKNRKYNQSMTNIDHRSFIDNRRLYSNLANKKKIIEKWERLGPNETKHGKRTTIVNCSNFFFLFDKTINSTSGLNPWKSISKPMFEY